MPLKFNGKWRFDPPADGTFANRSVPVAAVDAIVELIGKLSFQGDRQATLEHFKEYFCQASGATYLRSSSLGWSESDLHHHALEAAANAPLFVEALYEACRTLPGDDPEIYTPDVGSLNSLLADYGIGYEIRPPRLVLREGELPLVAVPEPPPTLAEHAIDVLQASLARSESLLVEGRGREAVQECLWLLESVSTAFRGIETASGTVEGKYFNQIVKDLRRGSPGTALERVLEWLTALHGFLSSPTGGGVRHGTDLGTHASIDNNEARLYCNLIRSYLSFLLSEHEKLVTSRARRFLD